MFSLVPIPQFQVNGKMFLSDENDNNMKKWSAGNSDLMETTLKVSQYKLSGDQQGYWGLL